MDYEAALEEHGVGDFQSIQLISHILNGEAKRYFHNIIKAMRLELKGTLDKIRDAFTTPTRQNRALNYVQNIHVRDFLAQGATANQALENVLSIFTRMNLRKALLGE